MKTLRFTKVSKVTTTGQITIEANTDEEAMALVVDPANWDRYLELSNRHEKENWDFEIDS